MIARAAAVASALAAAVALALADDPARAEEPAPDPDFAIVARVLQSPRCQNCHPAGDAPHVGDRGRRHPMNVSREGMSAGLPCTTCHRASNAPFEHGPPGVAGWRMPPPERPMVFEGRTPRALCEQIKDPAQNGGKSLADLHDHFAKDPFVQWGWSPGPGRTTPPVAHDALVAAVDRWLARGAPCP